MILHIRTCVIPYTCIHSDLYVTIELQHIYTKGHAFIRMYVQVNAMFNEHHNS